MTSFITLPCSGSDAHLALWNENEDGLIELVSVHRNVEEIDGYEGIETYRFEVPTTFDSASAINQGHYPVADADGKPLWADCRIEFNLQSYYINTVPGAGALKSVDMYGGVQFVSDTPMNVYDRRGIIADRRCEQYTTCNTYQHAGAFKGFRLMSGKLGDPFEHGQVEVYVRLVDDPRRVCKLVSAPTMNP